MKQIYLKFSMLLLCLVVGLNSAWGETVTYIVASTKDVSTSGTAPSGSTAAYSQTYGTKCQMTAKNTATLTLSGFDGCTITGVNVSTKTNANSGAGSFTVAIGDAQLGTLSVDKLGNTYVDKSITITNTQVASGENIVISANCTTNSLYCQSYTITYTESGKTTLEKPSNLSSSNVTGTTADLSWDAVSNASSYKVKIGSKEYEAYSNSYHATGLETETEYKWSVKALAGISNSYGDSDYSSESSFNTIAFKNSAGTYNIVPNSAFWGSTQDGAKNVSTNTEFGPKTKNGISVYMNSGKSTNSYMKSDHCRVYTGYTVTITAPVGFILTAINFTGSTWANPSADKGTMNSKSWTGSANSVNFSFSGTSYISNIEVTYVAAKTLQSIAVSGTPTKTTYQAGENFDPAGLIVTGTYDDGSNSTITEGITWSTPAALTEGQTSVDITATVNDITSESYTVNGLTVCAIGNPEIPTDSPITFDFTKKDYGIKVGSTENSTVYETSSTTVTEGIVSMTINSTKYRIWNNGTTTDLRFFKTEDSTTNSWTISVPNEYEITEIIFTGGSVSGITAGDNGSTNYDNSTKESKWIGKAKSVTFTSTNSNKAEISTITVSYATNSAVEPIFSPQTLTFKAGDEDGYYATFSSPSVTFFPNDVIVNTVVVENGSLVMLSGEDDVFDEDIVTVGDNTVDGYYVPANTGILIYSVDEQATYYTVANKNVEDVDPDFNMLKPASETMSGDYKFYKLAYGDYSAKTALGFYYGAENGGAFNCKTGTAYLAVPSTTTPTKSFVFGESATSIKSISNVLDVNAPIYNIAGQRVDASVKGILIQNGKKFFNK